MDTNHLRLLEAAQTGDVKLLKELLRDDPQLLNNFSLATGENPLYFASAAGHVDFFKAILELKPDFAQEINQHGFSPMHVASANGYLEIVRALQREVTGISRVKGRDQWTPLHYAARRGRVDIIREIVMACPESVEDVTLQGETALHYSVKNSQFVAIKALVDLVQELDRRHVLNMKDCLGNSVLHLATWKKQHQVVEWLVGIGTAPAGVLEIDSVNQSSLTALDLLLIFPSEAGDRETEEILRGAGALRAQERIQSSSDIPLSGQNHNQMASETHQQQLNNVASTTPNIVPSSSDVPSVDQNQEPVASTEIEIVPSSDAPQVRQEPVASTEIEIVQSSDAPQVRQEPVASTEIEIVQSSDAPQVRQEPVASTEIETVQSSDVPSAGQNDIQMVPLTPHEQPNNASTIPDVVIPVSADIQNHDQIASQTTQEELDDMEYFKFQKGKDSVDNARTALLVVAVLVATASYEIALNPPGGLWSDTNLSTNGTEPPHLAGTSNIASYYPAYTIFGAILNCIGFSVSLQMIYVLTTNFPLRLELIVCGLAMYVTYINGLITISPGETAGWYSLFALTPFLPPVVLFVARRVRKVLIKLGPLLSDLKESIIRKYKG